MFDMKRFNLVTAGMTALVLLSSHTAFAVYDPQGAVKSGKRWAISAGLRTGYDDNTTTATNDKKGSFFSGLDLGGRYSYPTDTSFFSVSTGAHANLFADRPGSAFDFANSVDFNFAHTFNPRLSLDAADHFRYGQEPQLAENNVVYRQTGTFYNNGFNAGLSYQLSNKWFTGFSISHDVWFYDDAGLRRDLQRQAVGVGPSLTYRLTEKTSLTLSYNYMDMMYDQSPRDAQTHRVDVGISQNLTKKWNVNLSAGPEIRQEDNVNSKGSSLTPYVSLGSSYAVSEKSTLNGSVRYSHQETDLTQFFASDSAFGQLSYDWNFARDLSSSTAFSIVDSDYNDPLSTTTQHGEEWTYLVDQTFTWRFRESMTLDLRYTWSKVSSDFALRDYTRNVVSLGASYLF